LHPSSGFCDSDATAISGKQAVGLGSTDCGGTNHALLWPDVSADARAVIDLNPPGFLLSVATGTSGAMQVGFGYNGSHSHALVWFGSAQGAIDLHQYLPTCYLESYAYGISEDGTQIVGQAVSDARQTACLWRLRAPKASLSLSDTIITNGETLPIGARVTGGDADRTVDLRFRLCRPDGSAMKDVRRSGFVVRAGKSITRTVLRRTFGAADPRGSYDAELRISDPSSGGTITRALS